MLVITFSFLLACSQDTPPASTPEPTTQNPNTAKPKPKIDVSKTNEQGKATALTPSPLETRMAAEKAGLTTSLPSLIPQRNFDFKNTDANHTALRTGILLADTVLTIEELSPEQLADNLKTIGEGFTKIKAGKGLLSTIEDMEKRVRQKALNNSEVLAEIEEIVGMSLPEQGFGREDTTGPLLQAGAWLSSINLVCKAIQKDKKLSAANSLLRHGPVAQYFIDWISKTGKEKASHQVVQQLLNTLTTLKTIAEKENITNDDIQKIITATDALLALV